MSHVTRARYTGATPGTDSDDYVLFSTAGFTRNMFAHGGIQRVILDLLCDNDGTLKEQKSNDGGTTWTQIGSNEAITATGNSIFREYQVAPYRDWRLVWTNGGTAQGSWEPDIALSEDDF